MRPGYLDLGHQRRSLGGCQTPKLADLPLPGVEGRGGKYRWLRWARGAGLRGIPNTKLGDNATRSRCKQHPATGLKDLGRPLHRKPGQQSQSPEEPQGGLPQLLNPLNERTERTERTHPHCTSFCPDPSHIPTDLDAEARSQMGL